MCHVFLFVMDYTCHNLSHVNMSFSCLVLSMFHVMSCHVMSYSCDAGDHQNKNEPSVVASLDEYATQKAITGRRAGVVRAVCGGSWTLFLLADNTVWGAGSNGTDQMGLGMIILVMSYHVLSCHVSYHVMRCLMSLWFDAM